MIAHALPQRLREKLLIDGEARQRPPAAADQRIERVGEIDHDLGVHGVLQTVDDLRRTTAGEDRLHQPQLRIQAVVGRTDQQRPLLLIANDRRPIAPGVIGNHAINHLAEELRQNVLVVDAVCHRHDDRPVAEFVAHLPRNRFQTVVLHRKHDDVDVCDVARPVDGRQRARFDAFAPAPRTGMS